MPAPRFAEANVYRLVMINNCDFARVRPGICAFDKPSSNWILADVIPFLRIAFCTSQNVIEKAALPGRFTRIVALDGFADNAFQRADPTSERYVRWNGYEKMQGQAELRSCQLQLPDLSALFEQTRRKQRGLDDLQAEPVSGMKYSGSWA
jgi:hypothetical protein